MMVKEFFRRKIDRTIPVATIALMKIPVVGRAGADVEFLIVEVIRFVLWSHAMIRKLKTGEYRLYSRKTDPKTGKRRNLGTFTNLEAAKKHEREVQYFKRQAG
jgi:hypothetical protein